MFALLILLYILLSGYRSRKESEVLGWSRILNNTRSRSQIFLSDFDSEISIG